MVLLVFFLPACEDRLLCINTAKTVDDTNYKEKKDVIAGIKLSSQDSKRLVF